MNFDEIQRDKVKHVEEVLRKYLPKEQGFQKKVLEAMNYSVMAGGKTMNGGLGCYAVVLASTPVLGHSERRTGLLCRCSSAHTCAGSP